MTHQGIDIRELMDRLMGIERQNFRLKIIMSIFLIFLGVLFLMGLKPNNKRIVAAEAFLLIDKKDKPRGFFGVDNDGSASISLMDSDNKHVIEMKVFSNGNPALCMRDKNGKINVLISSVDGEPAIIINQKDGKGSASLRGNLVESQNWPGLLISDETGKNRVILGIMNDSPVLFLNDNNKNPRAMISITKEGSPIIKLMNKRGNNIFSAP